MEYTLYLRPVLPDELVKEVELSIEVSFPNKESSREFLEGAFALQKTLGAKTFTFAPEKVGVKVKVVPPWEYQVGGIDVLVDSSYGLGVLVELQPENQSVFAPIARYRGVCRIDMP